MKKGIAMTLALCALQSAAYEWTERHDQLLVGLLIDTHVPPLTIGTNGIITPSPLPPALTPRLALLYQFSDQFCPDITDAEMVGHLMRIIDKFLTEAETGIGIENGRERKINIRGVVRGAGLLLPYLVVLDNPNAESQLEHYLAKVTFNEELRNKVISYSKMNYPFADETWAIDLFQETALKTLLPLLNDEKRTTLVKAIMTNELYGIMAKGLAHGVIEQPRSQENETHNPSRKVDIVTNALAKEPPQNIQNSEPKTHDDKVENAKSKTTWFRIVVAVCIVLLGGIYAWRKTARRKSDGGTE